MLRPSCAAMWASQARLSACTGEARPCLWPHPETLGSSLGKLHDKLSVLCALCIIHGHLAPLILDDFEVIVGCARCMHMPMSG